MESDVEPDPPSLRFDPQSTLYDRGHIAADLTAMSTEEAAAGPPTMRWFKMLRVDPIAEIAFRVQRGFAPGVKGSPDHIHTHPWTEECYMLDGENQDYSGDIDGHWRWLPGSYVCRVPNEGLHRDSLRLNGRSTLIVRQGGTAGPVRPPSARLSRTAPPSPPRPGHLRRIASSGHAAQSNSGSSTAPKHLPEPRQVGVGQRRPEYGGDVGLEVRDVAGAGEDRRHCRVGDRGFVAGGRQRLDLVGPEQPVERRSRRQRDGRDHALRQGVGEAGRIGERGADRDHGEHRGAGLDGTGQDVAFSARAQGVVGDHHHVEPSLVQGEPASGGGGPPAAPR